MMQPKGYVHIYTGNGKGKTTATLGLALRAAGQGFRTYIGQFMKGRFYGELHMIKGISAIDIVQYGGPFCIHKEEVTPVHVEMAEKGLQSFKDEMARQRYDIMVMDEVCVAVWFGLLKEEDVLDVIKAKPEKMELILTGRKATPRLIHHADLVTEMKEVKHYYDSLGIPARKGIEI